MGELHILKTMVQTLYHMQMINQIKLFMDNNNETAINTHDFYSFILNLQQ